MRTLFVVAIVALAVAAYSTSQMPVPDSTMTPDQLKKLEGQFMTAAATRGSAGYMSYYAEESVEVPNGADFLTGKATIAKTMGFLDDKNNSLIWKPVGADVSGDLGYTYGTYEFRSKDKEGKLHTEYGKYTSIWKRQKDGSWKVVLDMGNASPAAK